MPSPADRVGPLLSAAIEKALGPERAGADPVLRPSQFADVQANAALALAKAVGTNPRELAARIVEALDADGDLDGVLSAVEVSGPGFLNLTYDDRWLAALTADLAADERLGVPVQDQQVVPIDYSAPNVAKEMHVGHLRTTIVGDCLARTLEHLGHRVVRQNHVGDWGTNFGMLIEHLLDLEPDSPEARRLTEDPNAFYRAAREKFTEQPEFDDRSRRRVVALQAGDPRTLEHWHRLIDLSKVYFNHVYDVLDVTLTDDDLAGESSYNDQLAGICDELEAAGIATMSDGALCVFLDGYTGREGRPVPLIIRKSDGGYGYGTTDLATIRHRVRDLGADRVLYVVGDTQALHLQMVWDTARKAGWLPEDVEVVHVRIGSVLGPDGKMFKTRSGDLVSLISLLDDALDRARRVVDEARPELDEDERVAISQAVGIGAVKYADLMVAHDSSYTFDLDRMVSLTGNTGPYLQYAAARVRSIFARADAAPGEIVLGEPAERALALRLLDFGTVVAEVGDRLEPHRLCAYLFELAQDFSVFYERCPVLKAETPELMASRLGLADLTLRVLVRGLDLLGIRAPERM